MPDFFSSQRKFAQIVLYPCVLYHFNWTIYLLRQLGCCHSRAIIGAAHRQNLAIAMAGFVL